MIPMKIQNAQMGALSADKSFQSVKHAPQNTQRIFEEEVKKQLDEAREQTQAASESEKSLIRDKQGRQQNPEREKEKRKQKAASSKTEDLVGGNRIEKTVDGRIKHLDVKI
ncbi:MAG: hypothetical protein Kow0037_19720 [Calditrichia bacterium]